MHIAQLFQFASTYGQRLFPCGFPENIRPLRCIAIEVLNGFWFLGYARLANERYSESLRVLNVVKSKTSFDTEAIVVGGAISPLHTHNAIVFHVVSEQAAHTAEGAHRVDFLVNHLRAHLRLGHQCPGRASLHTLATSNATATAHVVLHIKHNLTVRTAMCIADDIVHLLFTTSSHAAVALNTGIQVDSHGRMRDISRRLLAPQALKFRSDRDVHGLHPITQLTMLPCFCPFVTLIRHIRQQQLQHHLLALFGAKALAQDLKAWGDIAAAAGGQRSFAFDFHHARTAIAICAHALFVAKVRNLNAMSLGRIENGLTFKAHHGLVIEFEFNARWRQQFFGHRGVHLDDLLWEIFLDTSNGIGGRLSQTANRSVAHHLV